MSRHARSFTRTVWLFLGLQGGWWGSSEIIAAVKQPGWSHAAMATGIHTLACRGVITSRRDDEGRVRYGLTRANRIPRDFTLADIEDLTGIRFVAEPACPKHLSRRDSGRPHRKNRRP